MSQGTRNAGSLAASAARSTLNGGGRVVRAYRSLERERRLAAIASLLLFLSLFLPWYQETVIASGASAKANLRTGGATLSGWGAFSFVEAAVLVVAIAVLMLLFHRAEGRAFHLPGGDGWVITLAGGWTCVLVVWRIFDKQGATSQGQFATTYGIEWGIFVALAVAVLLAYSGNRIRAAHVPEPPLPGEDDDDRGTTPRASVRADERAARRAPRSPGFSIPQAKRLLDDDPPTAAVTEADAYAPGPSPEPKPEATPRQRSGSADGRPARRQEREPGWLTGRSNSRDRSSSRDGSGSRDEDETRSDAPRRQTPPAAPRQPPPAPPSRERNEAWEVSDFDYDRSVRAPRTRPEPAPDPESTASRGPDRDSGPVDDLDYYIDASADETVVDRPPSRRTPPPRDEDETVVDRPPSRRTPPPRDEDETVIDRRPRRANGNDDPPRSRSRRRRT